MDANVVGWTRTGGGVLLLLMTPSGAEDGSALPDGDRQKLALARAVVVSIMGRPAAYTGLFEVTLSLGDNSISVRPPPLENPMVFDPPVIEDSALDRVEQVLEKVPSLDFDAQNRVRLALRWYQRALGDHRLPMAIAGDVDELIDYWVALETLSRTEGKRAAGAIIKILAKIHNITTQRAGQSFPISKVYERRGEAMHQGDLQQGISLDLERFLSDVFIDILSIHVLGLPGTPRTSQYLDGRAYDFL
jgi:hypothetical protein